MRSVKRAHQIVEAARRLVDVKGSDFTTHELVKEAGVAVKTFYKHFEGKDQVLLAVLEDIISETCQELARAGQELPDPISRLRFYIRSVIDGLRVGTSEGPPRFITTEHWRLNHLHPEELAQATRGFSDLLLPEIKAATEADLLAPRDTAYDAWLISQLLIAVFHHYEYRRAERPVEEVADRVWEFCFAALGGRHD
jgi:AcrR family transcriptional regulator